MVKLRDAIDLIDGQLRPIMEATVTQVNLEMTATTHKYFVQCETVYLPTFIQEDALHDTANLDDTRLNAYTLTVKREFPTDSINDGQVSTPNLELCFMAYPHNFAVHPDNVNSDFVWCIRAFLARVLPPNTENYTGFQAEGREALLLFTPKPSEHCERLKKNLTELCVNFAAAVRREYISRPCS